MIEFFVQGKPRPRGSKTAMPVYRGTKKDRQPVIKDGRIVMRYVDAAKGSGDWMAAIAKEAEQFRCEPLWDCAITMHCVFCYPRLPTHLSTAKKATPGQLRPSAPMFKVTMPDVLKLGRAVEDALKGVIYVDDARIVKHSSIKVWSEYLGVLVQVWKTQGFMSNCDNTIDSYLKSQQEARPF